MKKFFLLLIIPLLSFGLVSCNDDDDVASIDLNLMNGVWEVTDQGKQDDFSRGVFLDVTATSTGSSDAYQGSVTAFYLTVDDSPILDRVFGMSVTGEENHQPLIELVLQGFLNRMDLFQGNYFYKVAKLTDTDMWWQGRTNGDNSVIKLRRRSDITPLHQR